MNYLATFPSFALYFGVGLVLLVAFAYGYRRFTPYDEIELINDGSSAAAWAYSGALLGFVMPMAVTIVRSMNLVDFVVWAIVAAAVQLVTFVIVELLLPDITENITADKAAAGVFLGGVNVTIGVLNAACLAG